MMITMMATVWDEISETVLHKQYGIVVCSGLSTLQLTDSWIVLYGSVPQRLTTTATIVECGWPTDC